MRLKRFLLSSAAVLIGVSGARAADFYTDGGLAPEPEPMEYVRICDAYGAGWFFIPGTETCLKFDGEVRAQYRVFHYHDQTPAGGDNLSYADDYRARLNIWANSETEYGTLISRIRFAASTKSTQGTDYMSVNEGPYSAPAVVDEAHISLAGFRVGFGDDYWKRGGNSGFYEAYYDGYYGDYNGLYAEYAFRANGWSLIVGAEDGTVSGTSGQPDPYAGIEYSGAGLYLAGLTYYDSSAQHMAWKVRADYDMSSFVSGLKLGGWYMWDEGDTDYVKGKAFGITGQVNLTSKAVLYAGYSVYDDMYYDNPSVCGVGGNTACGSNNGSSMFSAGISWHVVPGLTIRPEYSTVSYDVETSTNRNYGVFNLQILRTF